MKYRFEAHGRTAAEIAERATKRIVDFADGQAYEIESIDVDKRLLEDDRRTVLYEVASVTAWIEDPT